MTPVKAQLTQASTRNTLPQHSHHFISLFWRNKLRFKLLPGLLQIRKLRGCLRARALYLLRRFKHLIHDWRKVLHVEPHRCDEERPIHDEAHESAPECRTTHFVQQSIVLKREAIRLPQQILRFHGYIVSAFLACRIRHCWYASVDHVRKSAAAEMVDMKKPSVR